jgi:ankyrin repeat protein
LRADPEIARRGLRAAAVLGEAGAVRERLALTPGDATATDDDRGWPPMLYACYSRWHQIEPARAEGLAKVVRILLDAGASPRTNDGGRPRYRSALKGSVEVDNPAITAVLLDAGANPDDGECIGEAARHGRHRCLELLLDHGARVAGTWALGAAVLADDPRAVTMLLDALGRSAAAVADKATEELPDAAASTSLAVVEALLEAGADPHASGSDGVSVVRRAVRAGRVDTAERLRDLGAVDDATDLDRFIGACLNADRRRAEQLLSEHPDLPARMSFEDRAVIVDAAASHNAETIAVMLDLGFSTDDRSVTGDRPLHSAAYAGNAQVVRLLIERGADLDARDGRFQATALAWATVGSGELSDEAGDWRETVRLLVEAGADREGAWIVGKPPSEEVMELVRCYGITPDEEPQAPHAEAPAPQVFGDRVLAEVARHLEAAYRDLDLDLLASLLHPEVRWSGLCNGRDEVLDWYRTLVAEGTVAALGGVEVDRDAVLLSISVSRRAEGARPAPPQLLCQVFTVEEAQVVEIRAYPDRSSALARR